MKLKTFLAALALAALTVSAAIAAPPPGKGKREAATATSTTTTSTDEARGKGKGRAKHASCRPMVSFVLKGEFVSESVAATSGVGSFAMLVERANKHGRAYVGKQVTIETARATKMKRRGPASLEQLEAGDRLVVHVRACKARPGDAETATATTLQAKRVVAHPKKDNEGDEREDGSTSTSTSTSTETATDSTSTSTATTTAP